MLKKRPIFLIIIMCFFLGIGYVFLFPEKVFKFESPTFLETVEGNWGLSLPVPDKEVYLFSSRDGSHGDGDAIHELHYNNSADIEQIKALSNEWIIGEEFDKEIFPEWVRTLIKIDKDASYFYLHKRDDYIIFELKDNKLKIYESYM